MARNSENIADAIRGVRLIIDGQGELIARIASALEGKTAGGGANIKSGEIVCDGVSYTYDIECGFAPKYIMLMGDPGVTATSWQRIYSVYFDVESNEGIYIEGDTSPTTYGTVSAGDPPIIAADGETLTFDVGGSGCEDIPNMIYHYIIWGD